MSSAGLANDTEQLARALLGGAGIRHSCADPMLVETHISWLVMLGDRVYKIKKPVNLGFLDFTTLAQRHFACTEELRLNRRTAPDQYLDLVPISGSSTSPRPFDDTAVIEYAVLMRRFDDSQLLSRLADGKRLTTPMIDSLALSIARFHQDITGASAPAGAGTPNSVLSAARDNVATLLQLDQDLEDRQRIEQIETWTDDTFEQIKPVIEARREAGFVRECHGDLHLENIYWDSKAVLFDAIEFSQTLRWTDVAADIAFTLMDLANHQLPAFANRLLNEYLAWTGDYGSLDVMPFYLTYRAMVRAKVSAIRAGQDKSHATNLHRDLGHYLALAMRYTQPEPGQLIMMCGLSGTGKTTVARELAAQLGAIHLRSDVERKRLFGLAPDASSRERGLDIYTADASERTFRTLENLSVQCLQAGYPVVVDATFIGAARRRQFARLAEELDVPWQITQTTAEEAVVFERLRQRRGDASEAGVAQYLSQQGHVDPFSREEKARLNVVDTSDHSTTLT